MTILISYSDDDRVEGLAQTLRRHGLRYWRDRDHLGQGAAAEADIVAALEHCSAAAMWLGGRTLESDFVLNIEFPLIFDRHRSHGLRIVPLFVDLDVGEAAEAIRDATGEEIASHNGYQWNSDLPDNTNLERIAARELRAELESSASMKEDRRPVVRMVTRSDGAGARNTADLNFNWIDDYPSSGALPDPSTGAALQTALRTACQTLIAAYGAGPVALHLKCHLHLAIALGFELRRTTGMVPEVELGDSWQAVGLDDALPPAAALQEEVDNGPPGSSRAAVELSISRPVGRLVSAHVAKTGLAYRRRVRLSPHGPPGQMSVTSENLNAWAEQAADSIRSSRSIPGVEGVDLFIASPVAFAVALGWRLNAVGQVSIFHPTTDDGTYAKVWELPAS